MVGADLTHRLQQEQQAFAERGPFGRADHAMRDPAQTRPLGHHDAPSGAPQARVQPQNASRFVRHPFYVPERGLAGNEPMQRVPQSSLGARSKPATPGTDWMRSASAARSRERTVNRQL